MNSYGRVLRSHFRSRIASRSISSRGNERQKLDGRVAVAVGCTDGIGLAIAERLAESGAHVVLSSRKEKNVEKAVDHLKAKGLLASGFLCHAGNPQERKRLIENMSGKYGGIDILVNNAGVNPHPGEILDTPDSAFDKTFDVNVKANFCLIRDAVPYMANRKHQASVLITSSVSGYQSHSLPGAYAVSKASLFSLVRAFMPSLIEKNIRINCLTLGCINTPFSEVLSSTKEVRKRILNLIPMGRFGEPEECAGLASFLCSDDASYITGESFTVAGGVFGRI